ncbi:MOXD1-like protein 2 [Dirofilaria immitis]|nr:MOXD1-like protein 2 [Dirofilaria immitis]
MNCTDEKCTYMINWWTDGKKISFTLSAKIPSYHWTGIGFSYDGSMAHSDIIAVNVMDEGTIKVLDMFSPGYSRPKIDSEQDLFNIRAFYDQGRIYANFSRYLISTDENDISINQCIYFLYPVNGGLIDMETNEIGKHKEAPIPSRRKICPISCSNNNLAVKKLPQNEPLHKASLLPEESITAESIMFDVVLRILNREWSPHFANRNTQEFHQLAVEVTNEVNGMVKTKFPQMKVIEIKKFKEGSVLAFMTLFSDDEPLPTDYELKEYLKKQVKLQSTEALELEVASVILRKPEEVSIVLIYNANTAPTVIVKKFDKIGNWIVLSIGVSLFLIATFLVCCIISRSRKVRSDNCATTASQNGTSKGSPNTLEDIPKGVGETTYQEWLSKVASKPGAQQHEELSSPSVRHPISRRSFSGPSYISHTQDANNFYGEVRLGPPGYYRPY